MFRPGAGCEPTALGDGLWAATLKVSAVSTPGGDVKGRGEPKKGQEKKKGKSIKEKRKAKREKKAGN